ncbi:MAG TPA: aldo/keto reductase [Candidatus Binatus sp.]|nr:aldo/keto reductase [Candidatus Binatus sp.]
MRVSELCLGTMTFGEDWGYGASHEESEKVFRTFADKGGNFIDTSINYTNGTSERFLGDFIQGDRDRFVIATKYSLTTRRTDPNAGGNHRKNLLRSLETSLKQLKTDYIDLYYLHMWDDVTLVEEVMRSLDDVVTSGKVRYVGISDTPAWIVARANTLAEVRGWTPFVSLQLPYSLVDREPERELLPMARGMGLATCAWGPLAEGLLTGKYTRNAGKAKGRLHLPDQGFSDRGKMIAEKVDRVAETIGRPASQVALNWLRQQEGIVIPIVGATKPTQIAENLDCLDFRLTPDQMKQLDDASKISLGFPHDFLNSKHIRSIIFGDTFSMLDR